LKAIVDAYNAAEKKEVSVSESTFALHCTSSHFRRTVTQAKEAQEKAEKARREEARKKVHPDANPHAPGRSAVIDTVSVLVGTPRQPKQTQGTVNCLSPQTRCS